MKLLALGPDYRIGADGESVLIDGVYASLSGAEYFNAGDVLDAATDDILFSVWFRCDGAPGSSEVICEKWDGSVGYSIDVTSLGHIRGYIQDAGGTVVSTNDGADICDGEWHHIAVVFDRSGNLCRYVDGVLSGSTDAISAISGTVSNADDFHIGANSAGAQIFTGLLCHARIQIAGTLISEAQILWQSLHGRDYSSQSWKLDGTRSYWQFDDEAAAANADGDGMITDGSGSGNHLDAIGGTTTTYGDHSRALSVDPGQVVEVEYDQYYRISSDALSEMRITTGTPTAPPRSVSLRLRGSVALS